MKVIRGLFVGALLAAALWLVFARGNPGGISDARYSEFKHLVPPKILYSCARKPSRESALQHERECLATGRAGCDLDVDKWVEAGAKTTVDFAAGSGKSSYDELLRDAKQYCAGSVENMGPGEFRVLEAGKT
jgi:hypothetical protein